MLIIVILILNIRKEQAETHTQVVTQAAFVLYYLLTYVVKFDSARAGTQALMYADRVIYF